MTNPSYSNAKQLDLLLPFISEGFQLEIKVKGLILVEDANLSLDDTDHVDVVAIMAFTFGDVDLETKCEELLLVTKLLEIESGSIRVNAPLNVEADFDLPVAELASHEYILL